MKRSNFSEQQIAFIWRQVQEGTSAEEEYLKAGILTQTYSREWSTCQAASAIDRAVHAA